MDLGAGLKGRHVLVTGASSGLGEHFARLCARSGGSTSRLRPSPRLPPAVIRRRATGACLAGAASARTAAMRIALYQPDQAGNVGTILRTGACFGIGVDIVEPCGFPFSDRALKRAGMDYAEMAQVVRHAGWEAFAAGAKGRIVLFTTRGATPLPSARFEPGDILLFGSESRGVPEAVHARAEARVRIPQAAGTRSLNLAVAVGIGAAEALRQTAGWPA